MLDDFLKEEFTRNPLTRFAALVAYPVLMAFRRRMDQRRYNGATLLGLRGVVVKSHGAPTASRSPTRSKRAHAEVEHGVLERIAQQIAGMGALGTRHVHAADAPVPSAAHA